MAKKTNEFDDYDMDGLDDLEGLGDDFDLDYPEEETRTPVQSVKEGFTSGLKKSILDRANIKRLVSATLGKGYADTIDAYDTLKKDAKDVFNSNEAEVKSLLRQSVNIASEAHPSAAKNIPKWLKDQIGEDARSEQSADEDDGDSDLKESISSIDKLFKFNKRLEGEKFAREKIKSTRNAKSLELQLKSSGAISTGINRLVAYQDKVTIGYQRRHLEQNYRMIDLMSKTLSLHTKYYEVSSEMLGNINTNTALPDYVKMRGAEYVKQNIRNRMVESGVNRLSKGLKPIKDNLNNALSGVIQGFGTFADALEDNDQMDPASMIGRLGGEFAGEWVGNKVNPLLDKAAGYAKPYVQKFPLVDKINNVLRSVMGGDVALNLNSMAEKGHENPLINMLLQMGAQGSTPGVYKTGLEELDEGMGFDRQTHRTINHIIPAYLSSMDRSLFKMSAGTDRGELKWSHFDNGLVSSDDHLRQTIDLGLKDGNVTDVRYAVDSLLSQMGAFSLSEPAKAALRREITKRMINGTKFEPKDYATDEAWAKYDPVISREITSLIRNTFSIEVKEGKSKFIDGSDGGSKHADFTDMFSESYQKSGDPHARLNDLISIMGKSEARKAGLIFRDATGKEQFNDDLIVDQLMNVGHTGYIFENEVKAKAEKKAATEAKKAGIKGGLKEAFKFFTGRGDAKVIVEDPVTGAISELEITYDELAQAQGVDANRLGDLVPKRRTLGSVLGGIFKSKSDDPNTDTEAGFFKRHFGKRTTDASVKLNKLKLYLKDRTIEEIIGDVKTEYDETFTPERHKEMKEFLKSSRVGKMYMAGLRKTKQYQAPGFLKRTLGALGANPEEVDLPNNVTSGFASGYDDDTPGSSDIGTHNRLDLLNETSMASQMLLSELLEITMTLPHAIAGAPQAGMGDVIVRNRNSRLRKLANWMGQRGSRVKGYLAAKTKKPRTFLSSVGNIVGTIGGTAWTGIGMFGRGVRGTMGLGIKAGALALKPFGWAGKKAIEHGPGAIKGALELGGKAIGLGISAAGATYGLAGKAVKGAYGLGFNERAMLGQGDVYRIDEPKRILIKRRDLLSGRYIDLNSGKPVKVFKDITGPVEDAQGNQVITQEDYDIGLKSTGESVVGFGVRRTGKVAKLAGRVVGGTLGVIFKPYVWAAEKLIGKNPLANTDAYVQGETKPRIYARLLKDGHYSRGNGHVIYSLDEINGALYDAESNIVIRESEYHDRILLLTRDGKPLYKLGRGVLGNSKIASKARNVLRPIKALLKAPFKLVGGIIAAPFKLLGRMRDKLMGKSTEDEIRGVQTEILGEQLSIQYQIYQLLRESRKSKRKKGSDEEPASNSWSEIVARRKKAREATLSDVVGAIESMESSTTARLDEIADNTDGKRTLMDKLKGGVASIADKALDAAKWVTGGLSSLWAGSKVAGAVTAVKSVVAGKGIIGGTLALGKAAVVGVVGAVGLTAIAVTALVGAVVIGGYLVYKGFKTSAAKSSLLTYLRFVQYGIDPTDSKQVDAMIKMEALASKAHRSIPDSSSPNGKRIVVDMSKVMDNGPEGMLAALGIDSDEIERGPDGRLTKKEAIRMKRIGHWIENRFAITYAAAVNAANGRPLGELDSEVKGETGIDFIRSNKANISRSIQGTKYRTATSLWNDQSNSPFDGGWFSSGDLWANEKDVRQAYDRAEETFFKATQTKDLTKDVLGGMSKRTESTINRMKAGTNLNVSIDGTSSLPEINRDIKTGGNLVKSNNFKAGDPESMAKQLKSLDTVTAVRYLTYGLTEFNLAKVEKLWLLEKFLIDRIPSGATGYGHDTQGLSRAFTIFQSDTEEKKKDTTIWYRSRFMKFFSKWVGLLIAYRVGDLHNGFKSLNKDDQRAILNGLVLTMGDDNENPWDVKESPWYGDCGTDSGIVEPYLEALNSAIDKKTVVVEGLGGHKDPVIESIKARVKKEQDRLSEQTKYQPTNTKAETGPGFKGPMFDSDGNPMPGVKLTKLDPNTGKPFVKSSHHSTSTGVMAGTKSAISNAPIYMESADGGKSHRPPKPPPKGETIPLLLEAMRNAGMTDPTEMAMFLSQIAEETGNFTRMEENLNYTTVRRMQQVWPSRFRDNPELARRLIAGGPEAIANSVYNRPKDLGNTEPGDGWKYRGRGYMQLTGKGNYAAFARRTGIDVVNNPDLVNKDPRVNAAATVDYWLNRGAGLRRLAQKGDIRGVTQLVNGGQTNVGERIRQFKYYSENLDKFVSEHSTPVVKEESSQANNPVTESNLAAGTGGSHETSATTPRATVVTKEDNIAKAVASEGVTEIAKVNPPPVGATFTKPVNRTSSPSVATASNQDIKHTAQQKQVDSSNVVLDQQLLRLTSMDGTLKDIYTYMIESSKNQSKGTPQVAPTRTSPSAVRKIDF